MPPKVGVPDSEIPTLPRYEVPPKKRRVPWDRDSVILRRLEVTAQLMIRGATNPQIADATSCSLDTARRDRERVEELWRRESQDTIQTLRARSVAQLREVQTQAWMEYRASKRPSFLKIITDAEREITELQGTKAPMVVDWRVEAKQIGLDADTLYDQVRRMLSGQLIDGEVVGYEEDAAD